MTVQHSDRHHAVVEHMPALHRFARSLCHDPADAEDLLQETLFKALKCWHQFEPGTNLRSWLFTIMKNSFCTAWIHAQRERTGDSEDCASRSISVPPTQEWHVRGRELEQAVARLPSHARTIFQNVVLEGRSYQDVARELDCPLGTIKSRVNRTKQILSKQLDSEIEPPRLCRRQ